MKFKILTNFQKNYRFYKDNESLWNVKQDPILTENNNKFHYWKFMDIDFTSEINENERYIFPIWWNPKGYEYFPNTVLQELIQYVKENKSYFDRNILIPVFFDTLEGIPGVADYIETFINEFNNTIPTFFVSADYKLKTRDNLFKFYYLDNWLHHLFPDFIESQSIEKLYINLNRVSRLHRCELMHSIIDNDLFSYGYNTWGNMPHSLDMFLENNPDSQILNQKYDILDVEDIIAANPTNMIPTEFCKKTFMYLVTETDFNSNALFVSEKTYKPISIGMPFMILGAPGILDFLQNKGYITFSRWIDENYDQDIDVKDRVQIIINNLNYLKNLSREKLMKMFYEMRPICKHNFEVYKMHQRKNSFLEIVDNIKQYRRY
jgi:hypothetical protein